MAGDDRMTRPDERDEGFRWGWLPIILVVLVILVMAIATAHLWLPHSYFVERER